MTNAAGDLIVGPAKAVNPRVKVTPARSFMGMQVAPESFSYSITLPPHSFRSFAIN